MLRYQNLLVSGGLIMAGGRQLGLQDGRIVWSTGESVEPGGTIETLGGQVLATYEGVLDGFRKSIQISEESNLPLDQIVISPNCLKVLPEINLQPRKDS
jgi:hypothetical protein